MNIGKFAMGHKRYLRLAATGLCLFLSSQVGVAQTVEYTPDELRKLAVHSVEIGQPQQALVLAQALLARDPMDIDALIVSAHAHRAMGDLSASIKMARRAYRAAPNDEARYHAAVIMSKSLFDSGKATQSQLWLRRSSQYAPNELAKARIRGDYRFVQSRNPWSTHLSFGVSPTSNLNNGSSSKTIKLSADGFALELQGTALALSGTEFSAGVSTQYRFRESQTARSTASASLSHTTYRLSNEAKSIAPTATGGDFASTQLGFGLSHDQLVNKGQTEIGLNGGLSKTWYGGDALLQSFRLGTSVEHAVSHSQRAALRLSYEWQQGLNGRDDARILTANGNMTWALKSKNHLKLSLGGTQSHSDTDFMDYSEAHLGAEFSLARPIFGSGVSFGVRARQRHYDTTAFAAGARDDFTLSGSVTVNLNSYEYYGFVPQVTVERHVTKSNVDLYDSSEFGVRMGIQSSF